MSFYLKNINDIFILNSSGKLGINKSPQSELDIFGNFYSERINCFNISGYNLNCFSGFSAKFYNYTTNETQITNIQNGDTLEQTIPIYYITGENYSGKYFDFVNVSGDSFFVTGSKSKNVTGNIQTNNLSGLNLKLNAVGNAGGIRGVSKPFTNTDSLKINTGYFSQNEFENFLNQYNNLPTNVIGAKQFSTGAIAGDYWFDQEYINKFLNLAGSFNNEIIKGHYSDRAGTVFYLPIPKTIKFLICKCSGQLTGCLENNEPVVCWDDCVNSDGDFDVGECKSLSLTGENLFNIKSEELNYVAAEKSKTKFINSYNNTNLIFEKEFHQPYINRSPSVTFTPNGTISGGSLLIKTSKIFEKEVIWMESELNKIKFYCEGSGCMDFVFDNNYGGFDGFPLYNISYITIA